MQLQLDAPRWLALIAVAIPLGILAFRWFTSMTRPRRASAALLRLTLFCAIALALAGLTDVRTTERLAVILLIDRSDSVRQLATRGNPDQFDARTRTLIEAAASNRHREDLLAVIQFAGEPIVLATPTSGPVSADLPDPRANTASATDLAGAIRLARAAIPSDASARVCLVTDGRTTTGDANAALAELTTPDNTPIPVDVIPIDYTTTDEVVLAGLDVPPIAAPDAVINARVTLVASKPTAGRLRIEREGEPIDLDPTGPETGRPVTLQPGAQIELIPIPLGTDRVNRFRATFTPDTPRDDRITSNNTASAVTLTPSGGGVLLVDQAANAAPLARVLEEAALDITTMMPLELPDQLLALQPYDLVILNNIPADALPTATQRALREHVTEFGAGLAIIGGPDSFGAGGWLGSELEPILPVHLDLKDDVVLPRAAIVLVLDTSGSMGESVLGSVRSQQVIANEGAALAIRSLDRRDLVGVITFDLEHRTIIPLAPNTDPDASAQRVLEISPGGGTNIPPALREAQRALNAVRAEVKHVIVLSDGRSKGAETLPDLAAELQRDGISVSTIGIGQEASSNTLQQMATNGNGEFYSVRDPNRLPRLFVRAVRVVRKPLIREQPFDPVRRPGPLLTGAGKPPTLRGLALTRDRNDATVTVEARSPEGEPVLAHWQAGLGRVVAFTSDAGGRADAWAADWLDWPNYGRFWAGLARFVARPDTTTTTNRLDARLDGDTITLTLDASDESGAPLSGLEPTARLYTPGRDQIDQPLTQTAPGTYQAILPATEPGNYIAIATASTDDRPLPPAMTGIAKAAGNEYRELNADTDAVRRIAARTGGRLFELNNPPTGNTLFDRTGLQPVETRRPLTSLLLPVILALLLLDIATRRVAWDRLLSAEYGAANRRATDAALAERAAGSVETVATLRAASERAEARAPAVESLSADDALRIVKERNAARAEQQPETENEPEPDDDSTTGGLLAAKRRARRQMDEDDT